MNSLRDDVKDAIRSCLDDNSDKPWTNSFIVGDEIVYHLADAIFDVLDISPKDQDRINVIIGVIEA